MLESGGSVEENLTADFDAVGHESTAMMTIPLMTRYHSLETSNRAGTTNLSKPRTHPRTYTKSVANRAEFPGGQLAWVRRPRLRVLNRRAWIETFSVGLAWPDRFSLMISGMRSPRSCPPSAPSEGWTFSDREPGRTDGYPVRAALGAILGDAGPPRWAAG